MSAERAVVHSFRVGRFMLTVSLPPIKPGAVRSGTVEWDPRLPGRQLTTAEQRQYDAGMMAAVQKQLDAMTDEDDEGDQ
jgi:hypothetical protein